MPGMKELDEAQAMTEAERLDRRRSEIAQAFELGQTSTRAQVTCLVCATIDTTEGAK